MTDRELVEIMAKELSDRHQVRKLTGLEELWAITCEYHTHLENRYVFTKNVVAEGITEAITEVGTIMEKMMMKFDLSDYHVLSATIIPELH